jgi:hypothetical protein
VIHGKVHRKGDISVKSLKLRDFIRFKKGGRGLEEGGHCKERKQQRHRHEDMRVCGSYIQDTRSCREWSENHMPWNWKTRSLE